MKTFRAHEITADKAEAIAENGIAYEIFAESGGERTREEESGEPGWFFVTSGFYIYNNEVGYFTASYNDNNGYEGGEFHKLHKVPDYEIKRGPMPKHHIVINGVRYYRP